jgi:hypothetical protein
MSETHDPQNVPQFETAEFQEQSGADACCICHQHIYGSYYRINGSRACLECSERLKAQKPKDTHAVFSRAILFGLGGALLGLILYSGVGILLHLEIGYVSLAVGYLVGKAMMKGSGDIGGRRYQWIAVVLTYAAVSLSAVPVAIVQYTHSDAHRAQVQKRNAPGAQGIQQQGALPSKPDAFAPKKPAIVKLGMLLGLLAFYGLTSPFLGLLTNPLHGAIGLLILFIGVRIAWQITSGRRMPAVEGPY